MPTVDRPKTAQDIFNIVCAHLRKQRVACLDPSGNCVYANDQGQHCAVGALLLHESYAEVRQSNFCVEELPTYFPEECAWMTPHLQLLRDLQELHDNNRPSRWRRLLKRLAKKHNLVFPTLPKRKSVNALHT